MVLSRDWLWDRKISVKSAQAILKNPADSRFYIYSALLLSRKNTPKEVLKNYLKPKLFLTHWSRIKRQMRKDSWNNPRIEFWQAIYETLKKKYEKKGITFTDVNIPQKPKDTFYKEVADKIKNLRKQRGLTQSALAKRLKASQQVISRIESGNENISLHTLKKITDSLNAQLRIDVN